MLIKTGIFLPEPRKTNVSSQEKNNKPPQKTAHSHSDNQSTLTWKTDWISLIISEKLKCSPALLFVWLLKMKQKPATVKRELSMRQNVFQLYLFGCLSCGYLVYRVIAILFACVQGSEPSIKKKVIWSAKCAKQGARNVNESFTAQCLKQSIMTEHWQLSPWGGTNTQANQMEPLPWNRCHDNDLFA